MKKITLLIAIIGATGLTKAQIGFKTIINDNFESATATTTPYANGFPAAFIASTQQIWTTSNATKNPTPATTAIWKQIYSSNTTGTNKSYSVAAYAEEGAGITGNSQCLKFTLPDIAFDNGTAAPFSVRLQSSDAIQAVSFGTGETTSKYEVKFWAKTDGATRKIFLNGTGDTLSITNQWAQYTLSRYVTGITATALGIDFCRQPDKVNSYTVYIDGFTLAQKPTMTILAATNVGSTSFTANWTAIAGATSYRLYTQTSADGGSTWTTAQASILINDGTASSYEVSGLTPNTLYQYRVTATDGLTTTNWPTWTQLTTSVATGINEAILKSVSVRNSEVIVNAIAGQTIELYNSLGQREANIISIEGQNILAAKTKGIHIVKAGKETHKVIL